MDRLVHGDRRGRSGRGLWEGGGIAEERLFNGRISEIVRTYICWQIYESAFLLKWGKLLLLLLLLLLPPPPPPPSSATATAAAATAVATAFCCLP